MAPPRLFPFSKNNEVEIESGYVSRQQKTSTPAENCEMGLANGALVRAGRKMVPLSGTNKQISFLRKHDEMGTGKQNKITPRRKS